MATRHKPNFVSVIVPSRNRATSLRCCLQALMAQTYPNDAFEVIVVDDGSTDETAAIVDEIVAKNRCPQVTYIRKDVSRGPAKARNCGIEVALGALLCFVDDDILVPRQWLSEMVAGALRHPETECFAGRIFLLAEGAAPRTCGREVLGESELDRGDHEHQIPDGLIGGNMAMRHTAAARVGPFDESFSFYGEDTEWQHRLVRAGGSAVYLPLAWAHHRRSGAELKVRRLLQRQFVKGRAWPALVPYLDRQTSVVGGLSVVVRGLLHAARYRCWVGIFRAAYGVGHASQAVACLVRGKGSPHVTWLPSGNRGKPKASPR